MSDIVFGKRFACRADDPRPFLKATACQRDVGCDDDVIRLDMFDNPIISHVGSRVNYFEMEIRVWRNPHPAVGDQGHLKAIAVCDTINLLFNGAGISIDENVQQKATSFWDFEQVV